MIGMVLYPFFCVSTALEIFWARDGKKNRHAMSQPHWHISTATTLDVPSRCRTFKVLSTPGVLG